MVDADWPLRKIDSSRALGRREKTSEFQVIIALGFGESELPAHPTVVPSLIFGTLQ